MAEVNEINGDVDHLEEHCVDENVETQRLRYAGQREPGVPGILQRKILSKYGTVRGVRHRVRVGIAAFSGGNEQAKAMVRGVTSTLWAWSSDFRSVSLY